MSTFAPPPTWVPGAAGSPYDVDHLPFGVVSPNGCTSEARRVGVRIGDWVVDLAVLAVRQREMSPLSNVQLWETSSLNGFLATGPATWAGVRAELTRIFTDPDEQARTEPALRPVDELTVHLPVEIADYVDFYCSLEHASNVGRILRPGSDPLPEQWRHLPLGYHGRAGTVVVSGTAVPRPSGQYRDPATSAPIFGPTQRLDIESELGFVVGVGTSPGSRAPTSAFAEHVFGVVLLNDWSARDIQAFEYVPLGPFLGKSFATSIAGWVTPLAALTTAEVPVPEQIPAPLGYLRDPVGTGYDIAVEVLINGEVKSRPPYRAMYWSPAQMLAQMTANGAALRTGDLFASGTISGPDADQCGSLLELSRGATKPWRSGGVERAYLEDGDNVVLRASARGLRGRIGLGEVVGTVLPANAS